MKIVFRFSSVHPRYQPIHFPKLEDFRCLPSHIKGVSYILSLKAPGYGSCLRLHLQGQNLRQGFLGNWVVRKHPRKTPLWDPGNRAGKERRPSKDAASRKAHGRRWTFACSGQWRSHLRAISALGTRSWRNSTLLCTHRLFSLHHRFFLCSLSTQGEQVQTAQHCQPTRRHGC